MGSLQRGLKRFYNYCLVTLLVLAPCVAQAEMERVVPETRQQMQLTFAPVAKKVAPAVVNIYTSRKVPALSRSPFMNDPLFRQFFGGQFGLQMGEKTVRSLGSGVLIASDGLVVTSNHVIKDSQEVSVVLSDRREFEGKIVLTDEQSDLALLRIDAKGEKLPFLTLRDSDTLEVGDLVLAVGNPFGVGQTVTSGIISALARATKSVADFQFFIQTDAAINPGNSGGALVDMDGHLIGVNTAIYSTSGASNGIGFAIPANMVQSVMDNANAGGNKVVRPWLGVTTQQVSNEVAESIGLPTPRGVLIASVTPGSPAAEAGIREEDVVLAVGGFEVDDEQAMHFRAGISKLGDEVEFKIWRKGETKTLAVKMQAPPENPKRDLRILKGNHPLTGATVANLSPAVAIELNMPPSRKGVVIVKSENNRLFQPKDLVLAINGTAITSTEQLETLLKSSSGPAWTLVFNRQGKNFTLQVR